MGSLFVVMVIGIKLRKDLSSKEVYYTDKMYFATEKCEPKRNIAFSQEEMTIMMTGTSRLQKLLSIDYLTFTYF